MKIVVVGIGKVGHALTEQLVNEGHDITVIDNRPGMAEHLAESLDVIGVSGNGAIYKVQQEAGVQNADLLIAATDSDELNMVCCLVAKKLGARHTIARVRNPEYESQLGMMRQELGLSLSINPERETAREIARILRFPAAAKVETFAKGRVELVEYRIPEGSRLDGMALKNIGSLHAKVLICAVQRGADVFIPTGEFVLCAGDKINVSAKPTELESFFRGLDAFKDHARDVMIIGGSRIAYYLAEQLSTMRMQVRLVDRDEKRCQEFSEQLPGVLVIHGDATDHELLCEEGLESSDAFVALTGLDELNIMLTMYARFHNVGRSIAKVSRNSFSEIVNRSGIVESVVSTSGVTVNRIIQYVRAMENSIGGGVRTLHRMVGNRVEALEFGVAKECLLIGIPFKDLQLKKDLLIACITRPNGAVIIPSGQDTLQEGDSVIIVTTRSGLSDINDILK